jgi:uncharacterized NAD-dependent epimerase/dehydratase family protein
MVILAEGQLDVFAAKTAVGLLRYCPDEVVGLIDADHAGEDPQPILGVGAGVPILDSVAACVSLNPSQLVIGVAPPGGGLPARWRGHIRQAIENGWDVVNGLHLALGSDAEFSTLAAKHGVRFQDIRHSGESFPVGSAKALGTRARRVLTVGTDCNIGKKITALEVTAALRRRGEDAVFVPTGQTGVMIAGWGVAIDAVVSDFIAGAAETMVCSKGDSGILIVEGQGSIWHPSYAGVTLGLMHGTMPEQMILTHCPARKTLRHTEIPVPRLSETIAMHESLLAPFLPAKVVGISLNCFGASDSQARRYMEEASNETGLPAIDCIRFGAELLAEAILDGGGS